jgi:hypothetical protein
MAVAQVMNAAAGAGARRNSDYAVLAPRVGTVIDAALGES